MSSVESKKDKERNEDLNPLSDDIEERVKRMLDPSVPDEPETVKDATDISPTEKPKPKAITVDSVEDTAEVAPLSAPVLPAAEDQVTKQPVAEASKSKKVIIPIVHDDVDAVNESSTPVEAVQKKLDPDSAEANQVQEITINDDNKTPADVAAKLDAAIAGLEPVDTEESNNNELASSSPDNVGETKEAIPTADTDTSEVPVDDPAVIIDPETDKAVDAIIAEDSDELLEIEDALRDTDEPVAVKKQRRGLGQILKMWWAKPALRWFIVILLLGGILGVGAVPATRYFVLNSAGVRAVSSLTVLDSSTQQPLKNVQVSIGNSSATTDVNGKVQLKNVHLGPNLLTVDKRAFAPITKTVVLGWGSNPLGEFSLTPTGSQYSLVVKDFLTGKPVAKIEATSGEASAVSDDKGIVKLTIDKLDDTKLDISIKGTDYRTEQLSLDPNDKTEHVIKLVPSRKQVFVSKRSGKYDIYSVYIDGKDEKLVLAGSGNEREDNLVLVPHPSSNLVAYVSTRANQHNSDGFLLSNLILINLDDNSTTNIGASERMQIVDWSKDYLVYVQIASGTSASSPKRYRLMSYNYHDETSKELASSNFFNDVISANGAIYYAPSSAYQTGTTNFYKVNPDGSGNQVIYNKEVWNIFRTSYDHFALSVQQEWYDYKLGASAPTKLNSAPPNQITQVYIDSPDGNHSAWIDNRDGKGVLLSYDTAAKADATLHTQTGLAYPTYWLNDKVLVYRVKSPQETADYAISIDGGEPVKIRDVTNSGGIDRWYYY